MYHTLIQVRQLTQRLTHLVWNSYRGEKRQIQGSHSHQSRRIHGASREAKRVPIGRQVQRQQKDSCWSKWEGHKEWGWEEQVRWHKYPGPLVLYFMYADLIEWYCMC